MNYSLFSSESVCAGPPDKICDQISDAVLDAALKIGPYSRVACETLVTTNKLVLTGEITCSQKLDYLEIAKKDQREIESYAWNLLDLSVKGITDSLDLLKPIYQKTASYGHFGNPKYPWEKLV